MKQITITTQDELDKITRVEKDEILFIDANLRLNVILTVFGQLHFGISGRLDCNRWESRYVVARGNSSVEARENSSVVARGNSSVEAWGNSSVEAWGNSSVVARGNSSVEAWGNSSVEARGNSSVEARENSSVEARENSSVEARGNSSVVARGNSSVEAWGNSSVVARGNSSVVAWGNSSVEARENSSVEAWGNSVVRAASDLAKVILHGFSVFFIPIHIKMKFEVKSKHVHIQRPEPLDWFENNAIDKKAKKVILFKKVSKDFQTQEGTKNETNWKIGTTVEHQNWEPESGECGEGKYHACSKPYFCDEFRNNPGDRYVAIEISQSDLYEWKKNPSYPHKIGFRKGKVMFECDRFGKEKK